MAEGLSNDRVCFQGVTKTGICELMAVHHRRSHAKAHKMVTGMVGIVTDAVVRRQKFTDQYRKGVENLYAVLIETFSQLN